MKPCLIIVVYLLRSVLLTRPNLAFSNGNNNSSARFQETYKRTGHRDPPPVPTFPDVDNHSGEGVVKKTCNREGSVVMPVLTDPSAEEYTSATSITLTGTASKGIVGPPVGIVDIGVSEPCSTWSQEGLLSIQL